MYDHHEPRCRGQRAGRGPSSFRMHEPETLFAHLALPEDAAILDAGCGAGDYALHAARLLGGRGRVTALDAVPGSIEQLAAAAADQGLSNIHALTGDITGPLPLDDEAVDLILLSTVLHIPPVRENAGRMFREFLRVLRPEGTVAVIECKKGKADFGPPPHMRLSPEEVEALAAPCGLRKVSVAEFRHTYLLRLGRA